uniref:protein SPMIP1 n=1 Tax=Myxine glutinosa TaxID=7769 RepID=UPI00359017A3
MERELGMTSARLKFLRENMERETLARLRWRERFLSTVVQEEQEGSVEDLEPERPSIALVHHVPDPPGGRRYLGHLSDVTARKAPAKVPEEGPKPKIEIPPEMRPITPETQMLLFRKGVHGRENYLKKRLEKSPEQKFDFPMLSSWEYGWKQDDVLKEYRSPAHGRSCVIHKSFFRKNGIFPRDDI